MRRFGKYREAWPYAASVLKDRPFDPKCQHLVSVLTDHLVDRWHMQMLNDKTRNEAYKKALQKVKPQRSPLPPVKLPHQRLIRRALEKNNRENINILDIGAGTGLLR